MCMSTYINCEIGPCSLSTSSELGLIILTHLRPRQNVRHFTDDVFKCIFLNENVWIPIKFSRKFVPRCRINNISALVQIIARQHPGDKPLSEPMMVKLMMHICITRPQWVNKDYENSRQMTMICSVGYLTRNHHITINEWVLLWQSPKFIRYLLFYGLMIHKKITRSIPRRNHKIPFQR